MENLWNIDGKLTERSWKTHGKPMENVWEIHGKVMEISWKTHTSFRTLFNQWFPIAKREARRVSHYSLPEPAHAQLHLQTLASLYSRLRMPSHA